MTTFIPLESAKPLPATPSFLVASSDPEAQMTKVIKAILKAKRVVIVCGAGISVKAGIPDFRSPEGLFQTLKRENPREQLSSGRDLFDASVFNSEQTTSLFCQMIARLSSLSTTATPTPFHCLLRSLDDRGRLLRVYTQNIDAIEVKAGLSFGVPEPRLKPRSKSKLASESSAARLPSPPLDIPRCIPLHGTIQTVHCQTCTFKYPLEDYLPSLEAGSPPQCPECTQMEETRQVVGKRARGIGRLRPSVVLYNETHQDGEGVGDVVEKDLIGSSKGKGRSGADLLLVVGTSLRVPGTKRMVREFAKAVRARAHGTPKDTSKDSSNPPTPGPSSPPRSPSSEEEQSFRSIYLNLDFPVPTREWEGVFDAWVQGDAQTFAERLQAEVRREIEMKEQALERKRRREEDAALAAQREAESFTEDELPCPIPKGLKRKHASEPTMFEVHPTKRRIIVKSTPNTGRGPSPPHTQFRSQRSGIILRIPPRTTMVPEVVIPWEPKSTHTPPKVSNAIQLPLTPPQTPPYPLPRRRKIKDSTQAQANFKMHQTSDTLPSASVNKSDPGRSFNSQPISQQSSLSSLSPSPSLRSLSPESPSASITSSTQAMQFEFDIALGHPT